MKEPLRVLLVEDCESDAVLLVHALSKSGFDVSWKQAQSAAELQDLLEHQTWDVVLADFSLPQFSAMAALMIVRERELDVPFVVVSGVVGEESAVEAMRAGAHDFVTKQNLSRLPVVVQREIRSAQERKAWRQATESTPVPDQEPEPLTLRRGEWFLPLALATSMTLLLTVSVELLQEWFLPSLSPWRAALVVLGVAGPVAIVSSYYLLARREVLMQRIVAEFVEHRRLNDMRRRLADRTRELEAKMQERQRRERHLEAQHAITRIMTGNCPLDEALSALLQSICTTLDWDRGQFQSVEVGSKQLAPVAGYSNSSQTSSIELSPQESLVFERLALRVSATGRPIWLDAFESDDSHGSSSPAVTGGVAPRAALAFPIRLGQEFLGVMLFSSSKSRVRDPELLDLLEDIGNQIGQFMERRRAESALQRAHEELELRVQRRTAELASLNEALGRSEANLRQAQQIAHLGSFEAYTPFRLSYGNYWSEEACRVLGLDPLGIDLSLDQFVDRWVHPEDRARLRQGFERMGETRSAFEVEHRILRPDGTIRYVLTLGKPCFDERGQLIKLVGTLHDVTERKQLEKQVLEVSENEQRRIGQDLHDDLCQHLAGIEFMSQALVQRLENGRHQETELAKQVAELVREAINQTRGLARGLSPVQLESRGLGSALEDLASHVQRVFQINCHIRTDAAVEVRNITVATHLYRIAQEAINNAIRHGKADRIEIELHTEKELACLRVGDNGGGFSETVQRGNKGMGLRIMHYRAGIIGASLQVTSRAPNGVLVECRFTPEL